MALPVTLSDLYNGKEFDVDISKQVICPKCRGSGAKSSDDVHTCTKCKGSGQVIKQHQIAPGFIQQISTTCDKCSGRGKIIKHNCPICKGQKVIRENEPLTIVIERGMPSSHVIQYEGESDQSPDHAPGDINFHLIPKPHPVFKREGNDLHTTITLDLLEVIST
jgi:DnaJ-class molecular chaperone